MTGRPEAPYPWSTADLLAATGGRRLCGPAAAVFAGIATDSRQALPGEVFLALVGETHDAHRFVPDVLARGVRGLVVAEDRLDPTAVPAWEGAGVTAVAVADTTRALGALGTFQRRRAAARVVALTGSSGKTTTRAMAAAVAGRGFRVLTPRGNFNNEVGLPLTLLRLAPDHEVAVLELGMNHFGEMDRLGAMAAPDIGLITNIGPAHLEFLGSLEGVRRAKGELLPHIRGDGRAVLNADDPHLRILAAACPVPVLFFGEDPAAAVRAREIAGEAAETRFVLELPDGQTPVRLPTPGRFMVANALAAAAVGHLLGLSPEAIRAGLEAFAPVTGRLRVIATPAGWQLIDDTYNANPASMAAAIRTLADAPGRRRAILVAGDMRELGPAAPALHREVGRLAAAAGVDLLFAAGAHAPEVAAGALAGGLGAAAVQVAAVEEIPAALAPLLQPGDWILVKGSRAMGMERVVQGLLAPFAIEAQSGGHR
jgi:UDP-N-acetylmuramoyl-tripeptide--D-alanyl-D-alanine ligase